MCLCVISYLSTSNLNSVNSDLKNAEDNFGATALLYAAENGNDHDVEFLITELLMDPAEIDNEGRNAFYLAVTSEYRVFRNCLRTLPAIFDIENVDEY